MEVISREWEVVGRKPQIPIAGTETELDLVILPNSLRRKPQIPIAGTETTAVLHALPCRD